MYCIFVGMYFCNANKTYISIFLYVLYILYVCMYVRI